MKKIFVGNLLVLIALLGITSGCTSSNNDPKDQKQTLHLKAALSESVAIESLVAEVTDTRTTKMTEYPLSAKGEGDLSLLAGTYDVTLRGKTTDGRELLGQKQGIVLKEELSVTIPVEIKKAEVQGLVFGEIFNNGETNGQMMHPDQYFTVVNNSDKVQYVDGLVFAITAHPNVQPADAFTEYFDKNGEFPLFALIQFPGKGTEYPIQPGEQVVVASTAVNHYNATTHPNSVDLSGADFEMVFPDTEQIKDVDNPSVPDMIVHFSAFGAGGIMHPRGFFPPLLFKLDEDAESYKKHHAMVVDAKDGSKITLYTVPAKLILDAVETGCEGQLAKKVFPASLDEGSALVTGCHRQELLRRKSTMKNGRRVWVDTNNSTNDFERVKGQTAYPKK